MSQLIALVCVLVIVFALHKAIEKAPVVFYVLAIAVAIVGIYFTFTPSPGSLLRAIVFAIQKGHVGFAFLVVVMFIGVFDDKSAVHRMLGPIRAELSIIGAVLMAAHFIPYIAGYVRMFGSLASLRVSVLVSLVIAVVILVLLVILAVTSFRAVKRRMSAQSWKKVQRLAYPFFILIYFHLMGYMIVPASSGSMNAIVAIIFYTVIFAAYIILRLRRRSIDAKAA